MSLPYNSQPIAQTHIMLPLLLLITGVPPSQSIDRNIGIQFTAAPESSVVPPGDLVFFACKTNIGKGEKIIKSYMAFILQHSIDVKNVDC